MRTLVDLLDEQVRVRPDAPAYRSRRRGSWVTTSWRAFDDATRRLGAALVARGLSPHDRVAIMLGTREEAVVADFAALRAGGIPVPIHPTMAVDQVAAILRDAGARLLFVEDRAAWQRLANEGLDVDLVVTLRGDQGADALVPWSLLLADDAPRAPLDDRERLTTPDGIASIFYTSGTTGAPKGVILTHDAFLHEAAAAFELLGVSADDEQLLFLPLAHIFGKILIVAAMRAGAITAFAQSIVTALDDAEEIRPTLFGAVPRLFEKVHQVAHTAAADLGRVQSRIFGWALEVGHEVAARKRARQPIPLALELRHRYADKLVLSKIRGRFGGRVRFAISGAAPLDPALFEWFHAAGILVLEAYGLTETCGALTLNRPQAYRFGTVGRALPGAEIAIGDDGEILARGPALARGYWTGALGSAQPILDDDGWFHTGDVGTLDEQGYLRITDRKKDLLITAGGKNVAPQRIEGLIARSPWIARAVVVGDRRPYLVALLVVDREAIRAAGLDPRRAAEEAIAAANAQLGSFESIKRFAILDEDLTVERGELTPTSKVRRRVVERTRRTVVDSLYT
jgi:long-chain acyl-CoA synthetase